MKSRKTIQVETLVISLPIGSGQYFLLGYQ